MDYQTARHRFGERVRNIRKEKGIKQEQLAELIGKTTEHVSFIERGERSPSFEVIIELANALNVKVSNLMSIDSIEELDPSAAQSVASVPDSPIDLVEEPIKDKDQRKTDLEQLKDALVGTKPLQDLAREYGIPDIFQDNGGKVLQLLILLGLRISPGREGNDAVDAEGNEYELKTLNISLTTQVSTHHHLNEGIIHKYRAVKAWYFAIYKDNELTEIWKVDPSILEPKFREWELKLQTTGKEINNPKISLRYVRAGECVYVNPQKPYIQNRLI